MRSHCYEIKYSPTNQARALVTGMLVILLIVIDQSLCTSTKTDTEVKRGPLQVTRTTPPQPWASGEKGSQSFCSRRFQLGGMVAHAYNLKTWEAEVGEPGIHDNTSKVDIRPCFKETERELEDLVYMKSWVQIPALHGTWWYMTIILALGR